MPRANRVCLICAQRVFVALHIDFKALVSSYANSHARHTRLLGIEARLILSVDRRNPLAEAMDTAELAVQYRDCGVVGIDFSGKPEIGHARDFAAVWALAR